MSAADLLLHLRATGFDFAADGDKLLVSPAALLTDNWCMQIRQHKPALLALVQTPPELSAPAPARPYRLTLAEGDGAHADQWDDATIGRFQARMTLFKQRWRSEQDAEDLAERLELRDREHDDRRICLECSYLGERGRCLAAAAGRLHRTDNHHEPVQTILQRCEAFGLRKGLT